MDKEEVSTIRRGELEIEGGWTARIPSAGLLDDKERAIYLRHLQRQGLSPQRAEKELRRRMQRLFNSAWMQGLREHVARRAEEYERMHGTLDGYRPERIQSKYFPGDNPGRRGKPRVREMLREMGEEARNE